MQITLPNITPGPWRVLADPAFIGKHPAHDHRFISTADADPWMNDGKSDDWHLQAGSLIASTRDGEHQAANAKALSALPDLMQALADISTDLRHGVGNPQTMANLACDVLQKAGAVIS